MPECPVNLWRGTHNSEFHDGPIVNGDPVEGLLYPVLEKKPIGVDSSGKTKYKEPEVQIVGGMVQSGGGTSLYDKPNFFGVKNWSYFFIPKGTEVDPNLKITGPSWNDRRKANHYQIEVAKPIYVNVLKGALDNLARAAIKKAYEDARK